MPWFSFAYMRPLGLCGCFAPAAAPRLFVFSILVVFLSWLLLLPPLVVFVPALWMLDTFALALALSFGDVSSFVFRLGLGLRFLIYLVASFLPLLHDRLATSC